MNYLTDWERLSAARIRIESDNPQKYWADSEWKEAKARQRTILRDVILHIFKVLEDNSSLLDPKGLSWDWRHLYHQRHDSYGQADKLFLPHIDFEEKVWDGDDLDSDLMVVGDYDEDLFPMWSHYLSLHVLPRAFARPLDLIMLKSDLSNPDAVIARLAMRQKEQLERKVKELRVKTREKKKQITKCNELIAKGETTDAT